MPLPALRRKQANLNISEGETLINKESLRVRDPDQRRPKNTAGVVNSPLNESLLMLVDLAHDIQVKNMACI